MREALSPAEFDAACRELWHRCPYLSETSGRRSEARNSMVRGHPNSKHIIGMARDFVAPDQEMMEAACLVAIELGLWAQVHDVGSGNHLHVQGLSPGEVPGWWMNKYGG